MVVALPLNYINNGMIRQQESGKPFRSLVVDAARGFKPPLPPQVSPRLAFTDYTAKGVGSNFVLKETHN
jgi:hypothetical protein